MKFTEILQGIGSPIAFYPDLVPLVGSHEAAILLCQLGYWVGKQHNTDGWIYKTQEDWFLETGLTEKQQRTARVPLVERGYIEERMRGIPSRLEYRVKPEVLNEVWDIWMIASNLKKQFQALMGTHGVLLSRGIQNEEIQIQMEKFREVVRRCHIVANQFFGKCRELDILPLTMIDGFRKKLSQLAKSLEKSTLSTQDILSNPSERFREHQTGYTEPSQPDIQVSPIGISAHPSNPVTASSPAPSKTTPKTTPNISQKSTQAGADFSLLKPQGVNSFQEKKNASAKQEFGNTVEVEVLLDTQQELEGKELNSQGQDCIFMKRNIPGGAGGENFEIEKIPNWVQEYEDKVRLGNTLPRSELLALAEYRLGDYASVYRESGRVLDASPNDIKPEFLRFLQWYAFNRNPDISFVRSCVNKAERDPERWGVLLSWISTFKEVLNDPSVLGTMLAAKLSNAGKRANSEDLALQFDLAAQKSMSVKNWWDLV